MKKVLSHATLLLFVFASHAQNLLDLQDSNPELSQRARIRVIHFDQNQLYVGGDIDFADGELSAPIVRLNSDGSVDESYTVALTNTSDLFNNLAQPSAIINGEFYYSGDFDLRKIGTDGSVDPSFSLLDQQNVQNFVSYRDSILVVSNGANLQLVAEDGTFRTIETNLATDNTLSAAVKLSSSKILLLVHSKTDGAAKYYQFTDDLILDESFDPVAVSASHKVDHIELLPSGKIFISGTGLEVNGIAGNGIYYIDESGQIDASSPHTSDLAFLDSFDVGIEFAIPLSDGKILVVGRADESNFSNLSIARLLSSGARDDIFLSKSFVAEDNSGSFQMLRTDDDEVFLAAGQTSYDGVGSIGINKINADGENMMEFSPNLLAKGTVTGFQKYEDNKFLLTGSFSESKSSTTSHIAAFSLDSETTFPWLDVVDLGPTDIMGSSRVLSNGDVFIGAYDRDSNEIFKIHNQDGTNIDLGMSQATAVFVESPISTIHESDDYIYAAGIFSYVNNLETQRSIIKMNKDYSLVADYDPTATVGTDNRITFSYLNDDDQLVAQLSDLDAGTSSIIRLLPSGVKDDSFNDISVGGNSTLGVQTFVVNDSLLLFYEIDFNNSQVVKSYNLDGELLDESFMAINSDANISDIISVNDSVMLVSGSFTAINNINKENIAVVNTNGAVYDDIDLEIEGTITAMGLSNDTLFVFGPGRINDQKNAGFYALSLQPNALEIESVSVTDAGAIELIWNEDQTIRTIEIIRVDPESNEVFLGSFAKGTVSFVDDTAEANTLYEYKVLSKNSMGENLVTTSYEIVKPDSPTGVTVVFADGDNILSWTDASTNETGFEIYKNTGDNAFELLSVVDLDVTTYSDEGIEVDNDFSYFVVALSSNFQSDPSDTVEISVFRPDAPVNPDFELTANESVLTVNLSWESGDEETESFIILESSDNVTFESLETVEVATTTFSKEIEVDAFYYYHVLAMSEVGNSDPSNTIEVDAFRPDTPTSLSSEYDDNNQIIDLAWMSTDERATSFIIYESLDNDVFSPIDTIGNEVLTYSRTVATVDIFYYYYVVASNIAGNSAPSTALEVNTTVLGLELDYKHSVYPNPSTGDFQIVLNEGAIDQVVISDLNGKVLRKIDLGNKKELQVQNLPIGIYIANFLSGSNIVETQKVVVSSE